MKYLAIIFFGVLISGELSAQKIVSYSKKELKSHSPDSSYFTIQTMFVIGTEGKVMSVEVKEKVQCDRCDTSSIKSLSDEIVKIIMSTPKWDTDSTTFERPTYFVLPVEVVYPLSISPEYYIDELRKNLKK